ncbi:MAG TPA: GAF domain-containing protein [Flavobacteriales bacterium]|nr:GAF domain-containing protein [Crocinitomicaceae bacterium]HAE32146.1 GAF domain-containing protein [Flavobacteriales bacterium]
MIEKITISEFEGKQQLYLATESQIKALIDAESNVYAKLANVAAVLKTNFDYFWVGFYLKHNSDELIIGPFQGPPACSRIRYGKGVCGKAWELNQTIIVPDVSTFPGHIACSAESKSEIVIPILKEGQIIGVLDVDSDQLAYFTKEDESGLERICKIVSDSL